MKKIRVLFIALCLLCSLGLSMSVSAGEEPRPVLNKDGKQVIVAIDAGHQKKANNKKEPIGPGAKKKKAKVSSGTRGYATKVRESKLNLNIALKLEAELKSRGYEVYMIRREENVNISNKQRALMANESGADICIRIHADGVSKHSVKGASALYPSKKNRYVGKLSGQCKRLSKCVLNQYCKSTGFKNRGLSVRNDLTGTNWSKIPVTLIELGFMSNASEDRKMQKDSMQEKMVAGIADGVDEYFNSVP